MKLIFLGTGTSQGVPVIGSSSMVAHSTDKKDKRLRSSVAIITHQGNTILIDCGPDFRYQMLRSGIDDVQAILFTHAHADHSAGLDDVRPICYFKNHPIDLYAKQDVIDAIKQRFAYCFVDPQERYPGAPELSEHTITDAPFHAAGVELTPIPARHGEIEVTGFRIENIAYLTDVSQMIDNSYELLKDLDILVINALRVEPPHPTHIILPQAIEIAHRIGAKQTYFTHISETMGFAADVEKTLPEGMHLAYDDLEIVI